MSSLAKNRISRTRTNLIFTECSRLEESGIDEPGAQIFIKYNTRNNVLFRSERYVLTEENKTMRDLAHVPYDAIYIMLTVALRRRGDL